MKEQADTDAAAAARDTGREALLMRAGGLAFAVYADECECVTPWAEPAPLPHAPAAVLGVVSVRGRMRTVLDPARLFDAPARAADAARRAAAPRLIASLAGDEQLALAVESSDAFTLRDAFDPPAADERAAAAAHDSPAPPARAAFTRGGETVHLLDPARLFDAAMAGSERRRRRG
ncbi:MAG TPA: chemotaxis protein CheW [Pyrinomonadaceae bacterium]|jgi:chemotaxis signal transduction protein